MDDALPHLIVELLGQLFLERDEKNVSPPPLPNQRQTNELGSLKSNLVRQ